MRTLQSFRAVGFIWFALATGFCCQVPRLNGEVSTGSSVWTTSLQKRGYLLDEFAPPGVYEATRQLAFGSNGELVVASSDGPILKASDVRAFVIETRSGRVIDEAAWKSKTWPYIFATAEGNYAVTTENGLALYSSGLKEVIATSKHSSKMASPDGQSLAAWKRVPGHGVTFFLGSRDFLPSEIEFLDHNVESISRTQIAYAAYSKGSKNPAIHIEGPAGIVSVYATDCPEVQPRFVSENALAIFGCDGVDVISTHGERLYRLSLDGENAFAGASRDGNRFVAVEAFYGKGHTPKLRFETFTVIDVRSPRPIFTVKIKELQGRESGRSGAALSPDGSLLAVNSLGIVRLFRLPAARDGGP